MLDWLSSWYNWPFLLASMVGVGLTLMAFLGLTKEHDVGVEVDGHMWLPTFMGFGRVPVSILVQTLMCGFGMTGLIANAFASDVSEHYSFGLFLIVLFFSFVMGVFATGSVGALIMRFAPPNAAEAPKPGSFVGRHGTATSSITMSIGQVRVDPDSSDLTLFLVGAYREPNLPADISRGSPVILHEFDHKRGAYVVVPAPNPTEVS